MTTTSITSHCPYCALNCGIGLEVDSTDTLVGQLRWKRSPLTRGAVCAKGTTAWQQVHHSDRITMPLVRRDGILVETSWEEALQLAADGFANIRREHGADANGVLSGGSLTNEKAYLMGKFARVALGTRHIDYNGRFCMVSAGSANLRAFGLDRAMTPLEEVERADVIVVVGANLSDAYPVMLPPTINKARRKGARVIVVDPRFGRWVQDGDLKVAIRPGTDGVFFLGLLNELERQRLLDVDYIDERTVGFDDAIRSAREWPPIWWRRPQMSRRRTSVRSPA
ncbi:MAG: molybdopterin-dependent oxidoreductase [Microthrixaceae bacterium]